MQAADTYAGSPSCDSGSVPHPPLPPFKTHGMAGDVIEDFEADGDEGGVGVAVARAAKVRGCARSGSKVCLPGPRLPAIGRGPELSSH